MLGTYLFHKAIEAQITAKDRKAVRDEPVLALVSILLVVGLIGTIITLSWM